LKVRTTTKTVGDSHIHERGDGATKLKVTFPLNLGVTAVKIASGTTKPSGPTHL
jgi:hypothetical protein